GNDNLIYDAEGEAIGFLTQTQRPGNPGETDLEILVFKEKTPEEFKAMGKSQESSQKGKKGIQANPDAKAQVTFQYTPKLDTSNPERRSFDFTGPIEIQFNRPVEVLDVSKVRLYWDSLGERVAVDFQMKV